MRSAARPISAVKAGINLTWILPSQSLLPRWQPPARIVQGQPVQGRSGSPYQLY